MPRRGQFTTLLEITGKKGLMQVNGKKLAKDTTLTLNGGDEFVFGSSGKHSYILQQLHNETVSVASTLASLSNLQKELSRFPSANDENMQDGSGMPILPSACELSDNNNITDAEMKDKAENDDRCQSGNMASLPSSSSVLDTNNERSVTRACIEPLCGLLTTCPKCLIGLKKILVVGRTVDLNRGAPIDLSDLKQMIEENKGPQKISDLWKSDKDSATGIAWLIP